MDIQDQNNMFFGKKNMQIENNQNKNKEYME